MSGQLKADELALLKPDALSVEKKRLILIDPSENKRYFTGRDAAHIEFAWDYRGEMNKKTTFLVDISKNRDFSPADKQIESSDEMISAKWPRAIISGGCRQ